MPSLLPHRAPGTFSPLALHGMSGMLIFPCYWVPFCSGHCCTGSWHWVPGTEDNPRAKEGKFAGVSSEVCIFLVRCGNWIHFWGLIWGLFNWGIWSMVIIYFRYWSGVIIYFGVSCPNLFNGLFWGLNSFWGLESGVWIHFSGSGVWGLFWFNFVPFK